MPQTLPSIRFSITTPLGPDKLQLRSLRGEEGLSRLFHFTLELQSDDPNVDFSALVGEGITVTAELSDGSKRYFHGVVARFVQGGGGRGTVTYFAEIRPALWLLTQSENCRIFQQKSVPDILEILFGEHGLTDFSNRLEATYSPREYCVQYDETAFAFVSRLMEDEGIFYFFEHQDGKHILVLADDLSAFQTCPGAAKLQHGTYEEWQQETTVPSCVLEENVIPGVWALDDFNFETPSTDLIASVDSTAAKDGSKRRIYHYPGGYTQKSDGETRTKLRVQEGDQPRRWLRGQCLSPALTSGTKTTLEKHARSDANTDWVLERVVHEGSWEGYTNTFDAFPADVPYRPPRVTPKPMIPGTQTAIVVGKAGEEIWTDEYGRIKVQFHWDQEGKYDENSSCWIRVAHFWAGKSWGHIFLPRIGHEVVVTFREGDPDRPLVTGSVYNAETTVPYGLPTEQTKSTIKSDSSKGGGGYNEIRFEDKKDSEEIYVQAEKDHNRVVKNNETVKVGFEKKDKGDQTIDVYNDRTITVDQGNQKLQVKTGNREVLVDTGNETHKVKGTRDLTVTGDESHQDDANFKHTVTKDYTLTISGNLTIDVTGSVTFKSGKAMTLQTSDSFTAKASMAMTHQAGTDLTNKAGTALTNQSGTDLTNKAGTNLTNKASISMTNQASASQTVDGGGMLTLKGGLVKIN